MAKISLIGKNISLSGDIVISSVKSLLDSSTKAIQNYQYNDITIDLQHVQRIDSAGVAFLDDITDFLSNMSIDYRIENTPEAIEETISTFTSSKLPQPEIIEKQSLMEQVGDWVVQKAQGLIQFFYLISDSFYYAAIGLFNKKGMRKGEFINQSILIGMNALPIVGLISFLIGLILALQSAAQMRQFGASIYVADLIAISMTREMGPIMTAIVLAGRSGSAIASEIATMVVTEETDGLKAMALNPIRYVLVPKIYAITMTMPMLTVLSMLIGILGALVIGVAYLDIGVGPFYREAMSALVMKDILTGLIKSIIFAWLIVITGAYSGFRVRGGSEGVGKATTASVVASILLVIFADSILGLIFYF